MGIRAVYGDPIPVAEDWINRAEEKQRRAETKARLCFFNDDAYHLMLDALIDLFDAPEVRHDIIKILPMALSNSYMKRVVEDICRPAYRTPPVRRITPDSEQEKYQRFVEEVKLDAKLKIGTRLGYASNAIFYMLRVEPDPQAEGGRAPVLDVMTSDVTFVLPDPRSPLRPLAIGYQTNIVIPGYGVTPVWAVWDDEEFFWISRDGKSFSKPVKHDLGLIPIVDVHFAERTGTYWNIRKGGDLEAAQRKLTFLDMLTLKLHRIQGEQVVYAAGSVANVRDDQTLDGRALLKFEAGVGGQIEVGTLDLTTQPDHYHKTAERTETTTGANHGLSRKRLNQEVHTGDDEDGLQERTEDVIGICRDAEIRICQVAKAVLRALPRLALSPDVKLAPDFGPMRHRLDREKQLTLRKEERRMGLRSVYDDVLEDNPEYQSREEAKEHVKRKMQEEAEFILLRRALTIPEDADMENPGQSPAENGAMGPARRDGQLGRGDAKEQAKSGASKQAKADAIRKALGYAA